MPIVHMTTSPTLHNFGAFSMAPAASVASLSRGHVSPVRRRLFDDVDDADHQRLECQLAAIQNEQKMRWNFDFAQETPLDGRFQWRRFSGVKRRGGVDEDAAPPASKMPRADVTIWTLDNNRNNNLNNNNLNNNNSINNNCRFNHTQQTKITDFMKNQKNTETSVKRRDGTDAPPSSSSSSSDRLCL